jgi:hypothetical protein
LIIVQAVQAMQAMQAVQAVQSGAPKSGLVPWKKWGLWLAELNCFQKNLLTNIFL